MKVLLVDDAIDVRLFVSKYLEQWGFEVKVAKNGIEALEHIKQFNIQLVISDWMMPEMDGIQLCNKLRTTDLGHYIYLIVLTSKSEQIDVVKGLSSGADDFITKPINIEILQARIYSAMRIIEMENKLKYMNDILMRQNTDIKKAYVQLDANLQEIQHMIGNTEVVVLTSDNANKVSNIK
ncbi:MAG: response regulator [Gammaproteobacteria bacterium]|nr:response regulator [Gammaproteobacteria bacterium]